MAQVPYSPVPTVAPSSQGLPGVNVRAVDDAFGAGVGQQNQKLAGQLERSSDEIFGKAVAIQNQLNDAAAKEADAQYVIKSSNLYEEYRAKQGIEAVNARPKFLKDLEALRGEIRDGLGNPAVQRLYDGSTKATFARTVFSTASHAADESRKYARQGSDAQINASFELAAAQPENFSQNRAGMDRLLFEVRKQGQIDGLHPDKVEQNVREARSKFIATQNVELARKDPNAAFEMYQTNEKLLTAKDREHVGKVVIDSKRGNIAKLTADEVMFGIDPDKPDRTLAELQEEAVDKVKDKLEADPMLKDAVKDRITLEWGRLRRNKIESDRTVNNVLSGYINGNTTGHPITSVDELTAYPEGFAAWNKLDETAKTKWKKAFLANAKGEVAEHTTDERWRLEAMAENDVEGFLNEPIGANLNLSRADKDKLMKLQKEKAKAPDKSPAIRDAMTQLRPMLQAIQLTPDRKDDYYRFQGALQDQIRDYQLEYKKKPPPEEIQKMGSRLIQEKADQSWLGKQFYGADRLYKREVPNDRIKQQIVDKFWEKNGQAPEDWQIRQEYTRALYQQTFNPKGPKKAQDKPGQPPESK